MTKAQLITLNLFGGLLALLILGYLVLMPFNNRLNQTLQQAQNQINQAQQLQNTFRNLAVRIAQSAKTEPVLRDLMARHDLRVNLDEDVPTSPTP